MRTDPVRRGPRTVLAALLVAALAGAAGAQRGTGTDPGAPLAAPVGAGGDGLRALVDRAVQDVLQTHAGANVLVGVSRRGERRYFSYGAGGAGALAEDSLVEIGSITKVFTAVLYVEAVQDGRMRPTASIREYLPRGVALAPCTAAVTLQDLASFRAGLPLLPDDAPQRLARRAIDRYTVDDFYNWVSSWSPGDGVAGGSGPASRAACGLPARYRYSNASVGLLGLLTERAQQTPWDDLVAGRITGPLGAVDTAASPGPSQRARLAQGHTRSGRDAVPWPRFAWFAAGALRSTAQDMLGIGEAALGHPTVNGRPVPTALTQAFTTSMQPLYQPDGKPFAQGVVWGLLPLDPARPDGARLAFKAGGTDGFNSVLVVDPRDDTALFAVADQAKSDIPALGIEIARRLGRNDVTR